MTGMPGNPPKPSGWEEPSPPAQRRNIPNYDDGTSLWGQQHARAGMQPPGGKNNFFLKLVLKSWNFFFDTSVFKKHCSNLQIRRKSWRSIKNCFHLQV